MPRRLSATERLRRSLDDFTGQRRKAAEYVVSHTREVTMLSLRKVARRARVAPNTLVLLARNLGYGSYSEFKSELQEEEAGVLDYFTAGARALLDPNAISGLHKLAQTIATSDLRNIQGTVSSHKGAEGISKSARIIHNSRHVYVAGMRATFGVAHYLAYLLQLTRDEVTFVNDSAGMAADQLGAIGPSDVLVTFGFCPYVRQTIRLVDQAERAGAQIIAITDTPKSPIAREQGAVVPFRTESSWVVGSVTAAVVVAQILTAQVVGLGGEKVLERLRVREKLLAELNIYGTAHTD